LNTHIYTQEDRVLYPLKINKF